MEGGVGGVGGGGGGGGVDVGQDEGGEAGMRRGSSRVVEE